MNNKGISVALAAALLITTVIGVVIVDQVAAPTWVSTTVTNESLGIVYNGTTDTLANNCVTANLTSVYDWTNATEIASGQYLLTPQVWPHRQAQQITWASGGFTHNGTVVGVNYTYSCEYMSTATPRLIMEYFAVIVGLLALGLGGAWLGLKMSER